MINRLKLTPLAIAVCGALMPVKATFATESSIKDETIVTAKSSINGGIFKTDISLLDTPRTLNVIDENLIKVQQATSLTKVLRNDPSIQKISNSNGQEGFTIRGFKVDKTTGFLRDGEQKYSMSEEPVELYESIEVLKGPAGVLYGQFEPSGLINMVTKKPQFEPSYSLSQDIGTNSFNRSVVDATGPISDDLRYRFIASTQSRKSSRHYKNGNQPTTSRDFFALMLDYDLSENTMLSFKFNKNALDGHFDSGALFNPDTGDMLEDENTIWDLPWSNTNKEETSIGFKIDHNFNENWNLTASFHNLNITKKTASTSPKLKSRLLNKDSLSKGDYVVSVGFEDDEYSVNTYSIDLHGNVDVFGVKNQLIIGSNMVDHKYNRQSKSGANRLVNIKDENSTIGIVNSGFRWDSKNTYEHEDYGVYLQDLITFNEQWQMMLGVRYDMYLTHPDANDKKAGKGKDETHNHVVPTSSIIYHPTSATTLYATYSESFTPVGQPVTGSKYINDGWQPDPVTGHLYEMGFKANIFNNDAFLTSSIFQITKDNIVMRRKLDNPVGSKTHIGIQDASQVNTGFDMSLTGRVFDKLTLSTGMAYIESEYKKQPKLDGKTPKESPNLTMNAWGSYGLTNNIDLNLGVYYTGSRYGTSSNDEAKKKAYTTVDLGATYSMFMSTGNELQFNLNVNNLFDSSHMESGDYSGMTMSEPRSVVLSVNYDI